MCFDEIVPYEGQPHVAPGSAVLCGALAAAAVGKKIAVITKMSPADENIVEPMRQAGIDVHIIPAAETSYMRVVHPEPDPDVRHMFHRKNAGFFRIEEMPEIQTSFLHLAAICDREFDVPFMQALHRRSFDLSADMQNFVRHVDPATREVSFVDVPAKQQIASLLHRVKLDVVEARFLTGQNDLETAAVQFERWGCRETLITEAAGVLARADGKTYYEKFSNSSLVGRTGRGDTTFAAYLARRMDHDVADSLKFAAALVSLKMEKTGPFRGTLDDVLRRLATRHV